MFTLDQSVVIRAPIRDVYAIIADPRNEPKYLDAVKKLELLEGDGGPGSVFEETQLFLAGMEQKTTFTLHAWTPGAEVVMRSRTGPASFEIRWTVREVPGGTELRVKGDVQPVWYLRWAQFVLAGQVNGTFAKSLGNLKRLVEEASGGSTTRT